jgi:uncharacterized protein (DUF1015 family)
MAGLFPFRALHPTAEAAARVAAVPYDVVNSAEARALADGNPLSFLHVSRAEIDLPAGTNPYADEVYAKAAANFVQLRGTAPLRPESTPSLYVYQLQMGGHVQTGVAGCYMLDEYDAGTIKKHERTRRDKEDDRTRHVLELRAQTGPVFLVHRDSPAVDEAVARVMTANDLVCDFIADDGIRHTIWRADATTQAALVKAFAPIPALYIADGHHRAASAARARQALAGPDKSAGDWDRFLAVAFPASRMLILPYNRTVKDLNGHTAEALVEQLRGHDVRRRRGVAESNDEVVVPRPGDVAMFLDGSWYELTLAPASTSASAADRLDVSRLQDQVLAPMLGIGDVRVDPRIDFVGGGRGTAALERLVRGGQAAVAFAMHPVSIDDLMAISDEGGIMPPKSTWFEPKLRDGLLSHEI